MLRPPRIFPTKIALALCGSVLPLWSTAAAQNLTMQVAEFAPFGLAPFGDAESVLNLGLGDGIKGDFSYGVGVRSIYDSNFFLREEDPDSEFSTVFVPWINYRSDPEGGAPFSFKANYSPEIRTYLQNSDLNDVDQIGDIKVTFAGAKSVVNLFTKYNEIAGTDRLTGTFISGSIVNSGVEASHQLGPRTTVFSGLSAAVSSYDSSGVTGAEIYTAQIGGLWDSTERLSLGPSLRYSLTESDNTGSEDAWALLLNTRYRAGGRIQLLSAFGLEYVTNSRDDGGGQFRPTGVLTAGYAFTERLNWSNTIRYATIPSPTEQNFAVQNLTLSTELSRELTWGTLSAGLDLNFSNYEEVGAVTTDRGIEQYYSAVISYRRKLLSERVYFDSKARYSFNDGKVDWTQLQLSAGLEVQF